MDDEMSCGDSELKRTEPVTEGEGDDEPQAPTNSDIAYDQTAAQPPLSMNSHVGYLFVTTIDQVVVRRNLNQLRRFARRWVTFYLMISR